MQLIGQKQNLELIGDWKQLPNFIIIQGDKNTGKHYMVLYLCELYKKYYVKVGNSVKEVRDLVNIMTPNSNTIYHFDNFDTASLQAKNALLKVTEETPPGNCIIITGGPQIKTLNSRARKIIMQPYIFEEMQPIMLKYFNINLCETLFRAGINTPAKVEYYKNYEQLEEVLNLALSTFDILTYIKPEDGIKILTQFDDRYDKSVIDKCLLFLTMLINLIEHKINTSQYFSYYDILNIILETKSKLERENTLRRRMLLFNMFYDISSLRGDVQ